MAQCDVNSLFANAKCFACLSPGEWQILELQLLCEILAVSGAGGSTQQVYQNAGNPNGVVTVSNTLPAMCIDTTNHIVWTKTDGLITNTGWGSP